MKTQPSIRTTLLNTSIGRLLAAPARTVKYRRKAIQDAPPFDGDKVLRRTIEALLRTTEITHFIETGTFLGHSTRCVAKAFPHLPVITIEAKQLFYDAATKPLR